MAEHPQAPSAKKEPVIRSFHGREFVDNYEWLRQKDAPETRAYLEAENTYTETVMKPLEGMRENIFQEIRSRIKETDMSVPQRMEDYWYYGRTKEGSEYGFSCRVRAAEGKDRWVPPQIPEDGSPAEGEEVLLDLNALAEGEEFFSLGASSITTSGRLLAYSTDTVGDERFELVIKNLETGELLEDRLHNVFYGATWAGEEYLFYTTVDDAWRPDKVWRHRIGTPQEEDVCVYHEPDEKFGVDIGSSRSQKWLMIASASKLTSEVRVCDMSTPEGEFRVLWERESGVEYDVDHAIVGGEDRWLVIHNATGPNSAVAESPITWPLAPLKELHELVPHRDEVRIESIEPYASFLVLGYRRGAIPRTAIMKLSERGYTSFQELEFEEELYSCGASGGPEWEVPFVFISYSSFTVPTQVFQENIATGDRVLVKAQEVRGGYNPQDYTATRLWSTAPDGTKIPVSLIHSADLDLSQGPHPTVLYGYGAYEASRDPGFSVSLLSMMQRGVIFAIAHVRGGGEMGRRWYEEGRLLHKRNTFTDFIAVADDLIAQKITSPETMAAYGGSAGGLLMGAVANMAPDRFCAIHAAVPFVDALTSILKPELPLTVPEWEEWGDPYHDPEVYDYMASYSPYENVSTQNYPDILATTSLNDTRVLYVEPAKWIAKLRDTATGGEFLLKTEMVAGHGGVSGRYQAWRQTAYEYAWLIHKITGVVD
ncbi:prolyl oligopeptidase family serine peptidase [Corynebacterium poyangense]|uniref:Prolyl oligopeptidase family serine peptidase n=1 Tax=Corynebacterium poyangense TaxID=2684405 RepID=A0A7H0SQY8_9CORY|nr:S9 family peptidase [Corynebacterium poyangense]QNQ90963.1 prolyl oligopeptidase family serine peptidase [Corynebacterium poyangense]